MYFQKGKWTKAGHRGGVAQLVEHLLCKQGVIGSNPFISTIEKWESRETATGVTARTYEGS